MAKLERDFLLGHADSTAYERMEDGSLTKLSEAEAIYLHQKHRRPKPPELEPRYKSILEHTRTAKSLEELRVNLLKVLTETDASRATKRKWREAADSRAAQLKVRLG